MHALLSTHVVGLAGVDEEVGLSACLDTGIDEREAVLWHHGEVVQSLDNLQVSFQVLRLADE